MHRYLGAVAMAAALSCSLVSASPAGMGEGPSPGVIAGISSADLASLTMSDEQRAKVTEIERDFRRKQWAFVGAMRELRWKQQDAMMAAELDADAARRNFEGLAKVRREMFEASVETRKRVEAVLSKEQLAALRQRRLAAAGVPAPAARPGS
jgi:Spy/CpxP family protein refolding chaperone